MLGNSRLTQAKVSSHRGSCFDLHPSRPCWKEPFAVRKRIKSSLRTVDTLCWLKLVDFVIPAVQETVACMSEYLVAFILSSPSCYRIVAVY
jgi:hypothetical protein